MSKCTAQPLHCIEVCLKEKSGKLAKKKREKYMSVRFVSVQLKRWIMTVVQKQCSWSKTISKGEIRVVLTRVSD